MQFAYTILYVPDVARAVDFYKTAFGVPSRFVSEEGQYAELETGATALAFAANELAKSHVPGGFQEASAQRPPAAFEVSFTTENVAGAFAQALAAGATPVAKPESMPWGQTVAYVRDLNGVLVALCTPMA